MSTTETKSESDKLWEVVSGLQVNLYGMQVLAKDHVSRVKLDDKELHLKLTAPALLTALEEALGPKYEVVAAEKYTIIKLANK